MAQKKHKLRQVDVSLSQDRPVAEAIRTIGVTAFTYYRWRKEFGGLKSDQVKRLKDLEKENARLRKAVPDLTHEKLILAEATRGSRFAQEALRRGRRKGARDGTAPIAAIATLPGSGHPNQDARATIGLLPVSWTLS
ncbi:Transposase [Bosea robiniae]|jgi:transposase-like protein|uniref:Transposase n=1 Tax=Bosea robiniae TaxID=1036780 RepID=A0ABY0P8A7_9HYPH|nr:Transposase [Bosea robiniae]